MNKDVSDKIQVYEKDNESIKEPTWLYGFQDDALDSTPMKALPYRSFEEYDQIRDFSSTGNL